ncbi:MAG: metal ABC transporter permease [Chloroflexi bacterium]|jgi:manganese/iron transport system permease protein|nr:metal ABC transporter permease [Chloroflexota bacterium]MBT3670574.1 metal ABC transporter permease [Chloroflexota bacterium]MBT4002400.1 metal ABC transporter permease [Chloroflexota bacterium]MBT4304209.1 metal ABC transporter permease [Chloroflexota bacterium]MBT4533432.1 metal ABC transporter permease [Chloroflexota bacterium]
MINFILDPLQYAFMQRGLAAAILVGIVCAMVGTFVVLRGMAFFGDALAHSILPGIAIGYLVSGGSQTALFWWGLVTAVLASLGIGAVSKGAKLSDDTSTGIIFAGMFALGIALISRIGSYAVDLTHFLFGNVLAVSENDLLLTAILGGLVAFIIIIFYKEFMVLSFDPVLAATLRVPSKVLENLLLVLIAVTIVVSLQTVGIALMVAMLVTPAASAYLVTRRMHSMMILASALAAVSAVLGLYTSFYFAIPSGASIVLVSTFLFLIIWAGKTVRQKSL